MIPLIVGGLSQTRISKPQKRALEAVMEKHSKENDAPSGACAFCNGTFPCDAYRVASMILDGGWSL